MENKSWIVGLLVLILIVAASAWGFSKNKPVQNAAGVSNTQTEVPKVITGAESYFSTDAKVMYFYQPTCHYCLIQSPILKELATEGYRVKSMDVSVDAQLAAQYQIFDNGGGTPTFIASNGDRMKPGLQQKDVLKAFLDAHK